MLPPSLTSMLVLPKAVISRIARAEREFNPAGGGRDAGAARGQDRDSVAPMSRGRSHRIWCIFALTSQSRPMINMRRQWGPGRANGWPVNKQAQTRRWVRPSSDETECLQILSGIPPAPNIGAGHVKEGSIGDNETRACRSCPCVGHGLACHCCELRRAESCSAPCRRADHGGGYRGGP